VFDPKAPASERAIEELRNQKVRQHLLTYARWRTGSDAAAEDLLADATIVVCDPEGKPWDGTRSFRSHMRLIMDDLAIAHVRSGYGRFEVPNSDLVHAKSLDPRLPVDVLLDEKRTLEVQRRLGRALLAKLEHTDPIAAQVFLLACEGTEEPAEQAQRLGRPVEEVYEALRRLRYHGAKTLAEHEQAEAARMKALRARSSLREARNEPSS
jgi:DNA-directed RNA polymerase specialized sigma24 family protein